LQQPHFEDFYYENWSSLVAYATSLTRDQSAGEELAQEALVRLYARWRLARDPRGYAFRIVMNLARDRWKKALREQHSWQFADPKTVSDDLLTLDLVHRLRRQHREVLLLHYWADLPVNDVAEVLARPAGTIKRQLHDARQALATALKDADKERTDA
jgi:RNA polymerase sigma-70 factor (ECF subfamily)